MGKKNDIDSIIFARFMEETERQLPEIAPQASDALILVSWCRSYFADENGRRVVLETITLRKGIAGFPACWSLILTKLMMARLGHRSTADDAKAGRKYGINPDVRSANDHKHVSLSSSMAEPAVHGARVAGTPEHADGDKLSDRPPSSEKLREMEPAKSEDDARLEQVLQSDVCGKGKMRFWTKPRPLLEIY